LHKVTKLHHILPYYLHHRLIIRGYVLFIYVMLGEVVIVR
jgi:hypothetical protein